MHSSARSSRFRRFRAGTRPRRTAVQEGGPTAGIKWRRVLARADTTSVAVSHHSTPQGALDSTVTTLDDFDSLLTSAEAAKLLRLSQRTLERFRTVGSGPRFRVLGRAVRYTLGDLQDYLDRCARQSTSEPTR